MERHALLIACIGTYANRKSIPLVLETVGRCKRQAAIISSQEMKKKLGRV